MEKLDLLLWSPDAVDAAAKLDVDADAADISSCPVFAVEDRR